MSFPFVESPSNAIWQPEQIEALAQSTDPFPVDFDKAWLWVGYSTKASAKRALEAVFKEGTDYRSFNTTVERAIGGTTREVIHLTAAAAKVLHDGIQLMRINVRSSVG